MFHFDRNSIEMSELIGGLVLLGPIAQGLTTNCEVKRGLRGGMVLTPSP